MPNRNSSYSQNQQRQGRPNRSSGTSRAFDRDQDRNFDRNSDYSNNYRSNSYEDIEYGRGSNEFSSDRQDWESRDSNMGSRSTGGNWRSAEDTGSNYSGRNFSSDYGNLNYSGSNRDDSRFGGTNYEASRFGRSQNYDTERSTYGTRPYGTSNYGNFTGTGSASAQNTGTNYGWGSSTNDTNYGSRFGSPGFTHAGKGPKGYKRSDEKIHEDVCEALQHDPQVDASDIEVKVEGAVVTLSGTVEDRRMKRMAEDCVEQCRGVEDVRNELKVKNANLWEKMTGQEATGAKDGKSTASSTTGKRLQ